MSIAARDWAYSQSLPLCQKFVLVALAERANENGLAWPSIRTLSSMTGACDKAVRNALKQLEKDGFISRVTSGTRSKTYQLRLEKENQIPVSGTDQPVRDTTQPVRDTAVPDTAYPVRDTTQPVSGTGLTGTTYRQTVKNRQEPNISVACSDATGEDWVDAKYVSLGDEVLSIAGHNPAQTKIDYGEIRQWLADARKIGHGFDAARDVILAVIREKCEKYSGRGKYPKWFRVPVSEAIRSGCVSHGVSTEIVDKPIKDAWRDHVNFRAKRGEKSKSYAEFAAEWRQRNAA